MQLMPLAHLGLRASEVEVLSLDDIDWQPARMLVHVLADCKRRCRFAAMSAQLSSYLTGRPAERVVVYFHDAYATRRFCRRLLDHDDCKGGAWAGGIDGSMCTTRPPSL